MLLATPNHQFLLGTGGNPQSLPGACCLTTILSVAKVLPFPDHGSGCQAEEESGSGWKCQSPCPLKSGSLLGWQDAQQPAWHWENLMNFPGFTSSPKMFRDLGLRCLGGGGGSQEKADAPWLRGDHAGGPSYLHSQTLLGLAGLVSLSSHLEF